MLKNETMLINSYEKISWKKTKNLLKIHSLRNAVFTQGVS